MAEVKEDATDIRDIYNSASTNDKLYAYKTVFSGYEGALVLEDLKRAHCYYGSTVQDNGQAIDPIAMGMAEGGRNVVLRILALIESEIKNETE